MDTTEKNNASHLEDDFVHRKTYLLVLGLNAAYILFFYLLMKLFA